MPKRLIERRRRGFFGWITLVLFWLANGLMALWLFATLNQWGKMAPALTDAEKAGTGIGMALGLGMILSVWACVAVITGLFAFMTRGRKEIIEFDT
jgi:hypothetical protein